MSKYKIPEEQSKQLLDAAIEQFKQMLTKTGHYITDPRPCDGCPNETENCLKLYTKQGEICVHNKK